MDYEFEIRELDPQPVAYVRETCVPHELGEVFMRVYPEVHAYIAAGAGEITGPEFARYIGFSADSVDLEAGVAVAAGAKPSSRVEVGELSGGRAVVTTHVGAYDGLAEAHQAAAAWIESEGLTPDGAPWESYVTGPDRETDPNNWRTLVVYPVR